MSEKNVNRRNFIKKSIVGSAAATLGLSFEEKALLAQSRRRSMPVLKDPGGEMPMGKIGNLKISRLIVGGNLLSGYAHDRDLIYVSGLIRRYNTDEKIMDTFELCEECGINTFLSDPREKPMRVINRYWNERGGNLQWIAEGHPKADDIKTDLKKSIDNGADAIYLQGDIGDRWVKMGRIDLIEEAISFIKENGLVAGVGGHSLEVPIACEKAGFEFDFYMKTLHPSNYWSFNPDKLNFGPFHADSRDSHDNVWCTNPEETIEFMKKVQKPWVAYKTLAAGAIHPREAFKYAFKNGADFICVGMFDFQVNEDAIIAKNALSEKLDRERPWRG